MTARINIWSSPRNISTAMMYAWRQRTDTTVVDEPLYAHYLSTTGRIHPGADEILASQNRDGNAVIEDVILSDYETPIVLFKQMAKHLIELDRSFLARCKNVLLTREPLDMLTSFQKRIPDATIEDTGFVELVEILDAVKHAGEDPVVVDSKLLLMNPRPVLEELCNRLGVSADEAMLSWPPGPKPEDGAWARYWYDAVHRSTGWAPWQRKPDALLAGLEPVLDQANALYAKLLPYAIS